MGRQPRKGGRGVEFGTGTNTIVGVCTKVKEEKEKEADDLICDDESIKVTLAKKRIGKQGE